MKGHGLIRKSSILLALLRFSGTKGYLGENIKKSIEAKENMLARVISGVLC
jgi:hypothetical protein